MKRILLALLLAVLPIAGSAQIATPGAGGGIVVATAGPVTLTGIVAETAMASLRIPANSIGPNGAVQITALWSYTNSANNKTMVIRFGSTAGAVGSFTSNNLVVTTTATAQTLVILHANNATNAQSYFQQQPITPFSGSATAAFLTSAIDTTADTFINIDGIVAAAGETLTLQHAYAVVFKQ
jgi:hypothetical protein